TRIGGAIQGVTLALTATTTGPVTVKVDADPNALRTKLEAVVNDYNAVVKAIHGAAGFGSVKATNPVLAGDSTLRTVTNRLSSAESPDRKSTRLNSSHVKISYAVFCLKK